jgi:pseudo-rSAM protein
MKDLDKKYWLYINPDVYCSIKADKLFLYNTKNGAVIENDSDEILSLVQSFYEKKNLGAVFFDGKDLDNILYDNFIREFCEKSMGSLLDVRLVKKKPVQLMPVLNLQHDVEKNKFSAGDNLLQYLSELNLYINQTCTNNCLFCNEYFYQNLCCTKNPQKENILSVQTIKSILNQIKYASVGRLNILGGNILQYPNFNDLTDLLFDFQDHIYLWIHYRNIVCDSGISPNFKYIVPVTFPIDEESFADCIFILKGKPVSYHFFIADENEYNQSEQLITQNKIYDYKVFPFYTKNNRIFFEKFIYSNREDIFMDKISFKRIFSHQKLNTNFFGSLTILPNGDTYANLNKIALGNIKTDPLLHLIDKEMNINTAWRKIRNEKPCTDCLYQYLCSSSSNYELAIGKSNLCHMEP